MAYNDLIVIQQKTVARDDYGEPDPTWTTYKSVWAEKVERGGDRTYQGDMPVFTDGITLRIHTHDAPAVTSKMRISYDSQYWTIVAIEKEGRLHTVLNAEAYDDE
jgi:SPP1 family predicted phage head-tail adaptor